MVPDDVLCLVGLVQHGCPDGDILLGLLDVCHAILVVDRLVERLGLVDHVEGLVVGLNVKILEERGIEAGLPVFFHVLLGLLEELVQDDASGCVQSGCLALLVAGLLEGIDRLVGELEGLLVVLLLYLRLHHAVQDDALHLDVVSSLAQDPRILALLRQFLEGPRLEVRLHDQEHAFCLPVLVVGIPVHLLNFQRRVQSLFPIKRLDVGVVLQLQGLLGSLPVIDIQVQVPGHHADLLCALVLRHLDVDVREAAEHVCLSPLVICLPEELHHLPGCVRRILLVLQSH
mmetsp:Transcript_2251/g.5073  ORF Transcript_2251/g.5073 Transcript_2251/m.5073 type:complete len:287 (-) Transcript_2251:618-1478(-)